MKLAVVLSAILVLAACGPAPDCRVVPGEEDNRRASAGCVILHEDHLLVVDHRFGGKLGLPGGGRKQGETAQCTAHRETLEETGLDVRVGQRLGELHKGFTLYLCHPEQTPELSRPLSLPATAWLEVVEAHWQRPEELRPDDWRYPDQLEVLQRIIQPMLERNRATEEDKPAQ